MLSFISRISLYSLILFSAYSRSENLGHMDYVSALKSYSNLNKTYTVTEGELKQYLEDINFKINHDSNNPYLLFLKSNIVRAQLGQNGRALIAKGFSREEAIKESKYPSKEDYLSILKSAIDIHETTNNDYKLNRLTLHSIAQHTNSKPKLMERAIKHRITVTKIEDFKYWGDKIEIRERPEVFSWPEYLYQNYTGLIKVNLKLGNEKDASRLITELKKRIISNERNFQTLKDEKYYLKKVDEFMATLSIPI